MISKPSRSFDQARADLRACLEIGPTPEFLRAMIAQQKALVRAAARRNDPDPDRDPGLLVRSYEQLKAELAAMRKALPEQAERWRLIRENERRARFERLLDRHDPAERQARVDAVNAGFGDRPPQAWQDDMSGVANADAYGAAD